MIKLSIAAMAHYLHATPEKQLALLRKTKYPSPGLMAQLRYYVPAREVIAAYHRRELSDEQLEARIATLRAEAKSALRPLHAKLMNTADVLERYLAQQGNRRLTLSRTQTWDHVQCGVRVTATPTMIASEHGLARLIFLQFGRTPNKRWMDLVAQLAYEV